MIKGIYEGEDWLIVTYSGKVATVPITIYIQTIFFIIRWMQSSNILFVYKNVIPIILSFKPFYKFEQTVNIFLIILCSNT